MLLIAIKDTTMLKSMKSLKYACYRDMFTRSSNIRIFDDEIADLTRQTYGDVWFDKSTIRHRIFEYSSLTESKCDSLDPIGL